MQLSRHSSGISISATAFLTAIGIGSEGSALATCTSCGSVAEIDDESGNAASTINFDSSLAAVLPAAMAVSGSAASATSALTAVASALTAAPAALAARASAPAAGAPGRALSPVYAAGAAPAR